MPAYRCPVCRASLAPADAGFECVNRHRYDRAREGYVNLLPAGRLRGRPAGDSDAMARARREVFDAGLYDPVIEQVADIVASAVARGGAVLDCGCGEGAYLAAATQRSGATGWGIDVSKAAVKLAARRHRDLHFAVASSYSLPFEDGTFDAAMSVFSPRPFAEMMRVLAAGGVAVLVTPGADHLHQFKELIYDDPRRHAIDGDVTEPGWGVPEQHRSVRFELRLGDPALRLALLGMTPFWWRTPQQRRAAIASRADTVTVDVQIAVHRGSR